MRRAPVMMPATDRKELRERVLEQCMHASGTAECESSDKASDLDSVPQPVRSLYPLNFESIGSAPTCC